MVTAERWVQHAFFRFYMKKILMLLFLPVLSITGYIQLCRKILFLTFKLFWLEFEILFSYNRKVISLAFKFLVENNKLLFIWIGTRLEGEHVFSSFVDGMRLCGSLHNGR